MTTALGAALLEPVLALRELVGTGQFDEPGADPAAQLRAAQAALDDLAQTGRTATDGLTDFWSGAAADGAAGASHRAVTALGSDADHAGRLAAVASGAADEVAHARSRLDAIADRFERTVGELEPHLDEPGVAEKLVAAAEQAIREAIEVVDELEGRLDADASAAAAPPPDQAPPPGQAPPTTPATAATPAMASPAMAPAGLGGGGAMSPTMGPLSDIAGAAMDPMSAPADPAAFGEGELIELPDGSTATAPNAVAADAVRNALTQLGVPYDWGGTTPGVGLDCSGLTQWAYREAGLDIPRLAQEQDIGAQVPQNGLLPGDLAVWDGHVAMVIGNGMMVEAGDPVQINPVRTTNIGQGFHGFFRPTA
ncbi:C40 family peptidase [Mycobacterium sp. MYCO198283]|uniref:C40 family peptidase n=1 Tax=Mycobacterium sp. MYCO198283 TaxID=2883505 RepID=UPI001E3C622C|nr:C40 family peptidase [Mycobacterium sp. MYCO198283]MCG5431702.1 C40 family peptidase [Mycobacterium sp. MYCO198283]